MAMTNAAVGYGELSGRRIVVTRPVHQQHDLTEKLTAVGADVIPLPLIEIIENPSGIQELRQLLVNADAIAWLVISSPNGARVVSMLHEDGCSLPPVAVIGEGTAQAVGHSVDHVSQRANAESFVEGFAAGTGRVVIVQGNRADETLRSGLERKGWEVRRCDVYRTLDTEPAERDIAAALRSDAVVLASGSAVANWVRLVGTGFTGAVVVIGPATRAAAHAAGLSVNSMADDPSAGAIVRAVASALSP